MILGIRQLEGEMRQTQSVMVVDFFAHFSQIGAMVLLISPEQIELESCACAQIEALEEGNWRLYLDDAGYSSERGRNAANLISNGGGLFALFSQIGAMVLLISLERIKLESCAGAQIEVLEEGNR